MVSNVLVRTLFRARRPPPPNCPTALTWRPVLPFGRSFYRARTLDETNVPHLGVLAGAGSGPAQEEGLGGGDGTAARVLGSG